MARPKMYETNLKCTKCGKQMSKIMGYLLAKKQTDFSTYACRSCKKGTKKVATIDTPVAVTPEPSISASIK